MIRNGSQGRTEKNLLSIININQHKSLAMTVYCIYPNTIYISRDCTLIGRNVLRYCLDCLCTNVTICRCGGWGYPSWNNVHGCVRPSWKLLCSKPHQLVADFLYQTIDLWEWIALILWWHYFLCLIFDVLTTTCQIIGNVIIIEWSLDF